MPRRAELEALSSEGLALIAENLIESLFFEPTQRSDHGQKTKPDMNNDVA
ncbi:hypothetical protein AWZ03_015056, partial [Drosophila navojoa]